MIIHWKIFTNTNNENKTKILVGQFVNVLTSVNSNLNIEPYHKGGYVSSFTTSLATSLWSDIVLESLSKAQAVGRGWVITGNIETEIEAWSNEADISGIQNIQMFVEKNA